MEQAVKIICRRVEQLLQEKQTVLVAIDGSCTSGKSTLAAALARELDCNVFHMDDFFLRSQQRTAERLAETGGNVDYERFREEVLRPLKTGVPFSYHPYDCSTGSLKAPVAVEPRPIAIIEGTYSQHPYFEDPYDLRVFLKVSPEVRQNRILQRPAFLHRRFFEEWIPMEHRYFRDFSVEEKSDLVIWPADNG